MNSLKLLNSLKERIESQFSSELVFRFNDSKDDPQMTVRAKTYDALHSLEGFLRRQDDSSQWIRSSKETSVKIKVDMEKIKQLRSEKRAQRTPRERKTSSKVKIIKPPVKELKVRGAKGLLKLFNTLGDFQQKKFILLLFKK